METLSRLDLKAEIFELWEECKRRRVCRKGQVDTERVNVIVTEYVTTRIDPTKKPKEGEYIQMYTEILCDKRLYLPTSRMIEHCAEFLRLDEADIKNLRHLWHTLSSYQHFSYPYLQAVFDDPESCLMEKLSGDLLQRSSDYYFDTLDFFYAVLAWRFHFLRKTIKETCEWWAKNFKRNLGVTEKTLVRLGPE